MSLKYVIIVNKLPDGGVERVRWCNDHFGCGIRLYGDTAGLPGVWENHAGEFGKVEYHFANEADAVLFALKWVGVK